MKQRLSISIHEDAYGILKHRAILANCDVDDLAASIVEKRVLPKAHPAVRPRRAKVRQRTKFDAWFNGHPEGPCDVCGRSLAAHTPVRYRSLLWRPTRHEYRTRRIVWRCPVRGHVGDHYQARWKYAHAGMCGHCQPPPGAIDDLSLPELVVIHITIPKMAVPTPPGGVPGA